MRLEIQRIGQEAIQVQENIPAKSWNMDSDDIEFVGLVKIDCNCSRVADELLVIAQISTERKITCSRCLGLSHQSVIQNFQRSYPVKEKSEFLDIDDDIREEILLNFPLKVLCKSDCKGVCSSCGANLNISQCNCKKETRSNNLNIK